MMRWVGIDEAGYGPNLGPLVMTAVVVEGPDDRPPDVWADLAATVCRAGGRDGRVWVDDSKRVYRGGDGLDRLELATLSLLAAARGEAPATLGGLLVALGAGEPGPGGSPPCGLETWWDGVDPVLPRTASRDLYERTRARPPFAGAPWRITAVRSRVIDPCRFNALLAETGGTKADVHARAFAELVGPIWEQAGDGLETRLASDKHGGRHFYYETLVRALPDAWIDRGPEGASLSRYTARSPGRRLEVMIRPRADADDGLVALASMVSKAVREWWMDLFNAHWQARRPGLRPTAGYPADSARFRSEIEAECQARGLDLNRWWRAR